MPESVATSDPADVTVRTHARPTWHSAPLDPERDLRSSDDPDSALAEIGWVVGGHGVRMRFAEGATFWVSAHWDEVWLSYDSPLTAVDAAHFLLEPVLAFVLRRRGVLVLHASAVDLDGRAVVLCGTAGAGKSTTAAACVAAGGALISDDIVAVSAATESSAGWVAHRGTPAVRLWDDAAEMMAGDLMLAPRFSETWEKRVVSPDTLGGRQAGLATPLSLICILSAGDDSRTSIGVEWIAGRRALRAMLPHTVANSLHDADLRAVELGQLGELVRSVPIAGIAVPRGANAVAGLASAIESAMRNPGGS